METKPAILHLLLWKTNKNLCLSRIFSAPCALQIRSRQVSFPPLDNVFWIPLFNSFPPVESSTASLHQVGTEFHEVFQLKQGRFADLPAAKITEMVKSNSLDNAPTQSLLSVVNGILDESVERKNGEIPYRVAVLLRKVVQEIERRISTQAEHLRTQNNLFKSREEKYQSRIRVLEALATGTSQETQLGDAQIEGLSAPVSVLDFCSTCSSLIVGNESVLIRTAPSPKHHHGRHGDSSTCNQSNAHERGW